MCVVSTLLLTFPLAVRVGGGRRGAPSRTRVAPRSAASAVCGLSSPQNSLRSLQTGATASPLPLVMPRRSHWCSTRYAILSTAQDTGRLLGRRGTQHTDDFSCGEALAERASQSSCEHCRCCLSPFSTVCACASWELGPELSFSLLNFFGLPLCACAEAFSPGLCDRPPFIVYSVIVVGPRGERGQRRAGSL